MKKTQNKIMRRSIIECLTICLMAGWMLSGLSFINMIEAQAAAFSDINQSNVFLKQEKDNTCTLASTVMMLRRAVMLNGNSSWQSITESSIQSTAWAEGTGLRWSFIYAGITVSHSSDLEGSEVKLIKLLENHPEGIVIYDRTKPHAVLVTDYTDGVFYCADPALGYPSGRIPIEEAFISLGSVQDYWYVSSPQLSLMPEDVPSSSDKNESEITGSNNTAERVALGDVDGNGVVELADAQMALKASLKVESLDEIQTKAADVDASGNIELRDAQKILKAVLKIEGLGK